MKTFTDFLSESATVSKVVAGVDITKSIKSANDYIKAVSNTGFARDQEDIKEARELIAMLKKAKTPEDIDAIKAKHSEYQFNILVFAGR